MRTGHLVFAQIMRHLPFVAFARMVERHRAQHKVKEVRDADRNVCRPEPTRRSGSPTSFKAHSRR